MDQTDRKAITSYMRSAALLIDDESCLEFTDILYSTDIITVDGKLKLICIPEIEDKDIAKHNSYCWVQINGKLAKGTYCNKNVEITSDIWDSLFSSEVIISPLLKAD